MTQLTEPELDETVEAESSHHLTRRTLVKGGLVAGGALWATPVVQVLGTRIAAAASEDNSLSWVGLVLQSGSTVYTIKFDHDALSNPDCPFPGSITSNDSDKKAFWEFATPLGAESGTACASGVQAQPPVVNTGSWSLTITLGSYTLLGYMIHDGQLSVSGDIPGTSDPIPVHDAFGTANATISAGNYTITVQASGGSVTFTKTKNP